MCVDVRNLISSVKPAIALLQETKLQLVYDIKVKSFLPANLDRFFHLDATGTSGGIISAWNSSLFSKTGYICRKHTLTIKLSCCISNISFAITNVYAPTHRDEKTQFLEDLLELPSRV
ncbi:hypothetical protein DAI22_03g210800 [Oryza sativa Japonica Group]|nr:hypothetical protein DAI22_03g210800 [Oryza sativa Japonica Group]